MLLRVILTLCFVSIYTAQNNLIIFSSTGNYFKVSCKELKINDAFQQELKLEAIEFDTLHLTLTLEKDKTTLNRTVFLLEKGAHVASKEFIFSLEQDDSHKKLKLVFITANTIKTLPNPLLPEKPKEDTTYKWRNNVYGSVFELKEGKPVFYLNIPKNGVCSEGITDDNLKYCIQLLARTSIESERFKLAGSIVKNNCFTSAQSIQVLNSINYELDKLKLLKDIYPHLTDKNNFKTLRSAFKFESSKKEFDDILLNPSSLDKKNKIICTKAVNDTIVTSIASTIKLLSSDYEKEEYMKEKYANLCYTSAQFKGLLNLLLHDREKLDLAKIFYNNITDKENLNTLNDVFSYKESINNFQNFLKQSD